MSLHDLMIELKGGGHFGHEGRPGKRGGSLPKSGGGETTTPKKAGQNFFNKVKVIVRKLPNIE